MIRGLVVVFALAMALWLVASWHLVNAVIGSPKPATPVRDRVEAVQSARNGQWFTAETLSTATIGKTVALRGTVERVVKTGPGRSLIAVDGVLCELIEFLPPKCSAGESVLVAGRWNGRSLVECAVYPPAE